MLTLHFKVRSQLQRQLPANASAGTRIAVDVGGTTRYAALTSLTGGQTVPGGVGTNIIWTAKDTGFGATPISLKYSTEKPRVSRSRI
ncbi:MAG: hypothetical protein H7222_12425 [Methylotenera sp.]|nr:hypothetical protein [Oligoflexia bacterium]